jgi:hypothetical protein
MFLQKKTLKKTQKHYQSTWKKTFFLLIEILSEQKNIKTCSLFNKNVNFKILALL